MSLSKVCTKCGKKYPSTAEFFHRTKDIKCGLIGQCKQCIKKYSKMRYKRDKEYFIKYRNTPENKERKKKYMREWKLRKEYGITTKAYNILLELQDNKCARCNDLFKNNNIYIDHDHKTGKVRGLLCLQCNTKLGVIEKYLENPESWDNYLEVRL